MAEVEFGGVKFTGGKMMVLITALSTLGGALWGGFEAYSRYKAMEEKIAAFESPDLSHIEKELAVQNEKMDSIQNEVGIVMQELEMITGDLRDIKLDVRDEQKRLYVLETTTQKDLLDIRKSIRVQIEEALKNPLSQ